MNVKSIVKYAKNIEKNNQAYAAMDAAQKRVAVAKDALGQLLVGACVAKPGRYMKSRVKSLEKLNSAIVPQCKVCAIGALLVSSFRMSGDANGMYDPSTNSGVDSVLGNYWGQDLGAFESDTLREMESAFEQWDVAFGTVFEYIQDNGARLFAILANVIENNGEFVIERGVAEPTLKKQAKKIELRFDKARAKALEALAAG